MKLKRIEKVSVVNEGPLAQGWFTEGLPLGVFEVGSGMHSIYLTDNPEDPRQLEIFISSRITKIEGDLIHTENSTYRISDGREIDNTVVGASQSFQVIEKDGIVLLDPVQPKSEATQMGEVIRNAL